jgi:8-oxo-dGTP pyrophosphatase MutT (NUDIX family)
MTRLPPPALWPAVQAAQSHDPATRVPLWVGGEPAGSVAHAHLPALQAWPQWLRADAQRVELLAPGDQRDAAWAEINARLRAQGLILAWRDEPFAVTSLASGRVLARFERAAARFWGTLTLGAHANGFTTDAQGRPLSMWVATRSPHKPTDPGLHDNLIGGGVPWGQSPRETLLREAWEEAGLPGAALQALRPGRVIRLCRDIPEGLQLEDLHCFDLPLPPDLLPQNQDGEVAGFERLPLPDALAVAAGPTMTVDAALVVLDCALRHGIVQPWAGAERLFREAPAGAS